MWAFTLGNAFGVLNLIPVCVQDRRGMWRSDGRLVLDALRAIADLEPAPPADTVPEERLVLGARAPFAVLLALVFVATLAIGAWHLALVPVLLFGSTLVAQNS